MAKTNDWRGMTDRDWGFPLTKQDIAALGMVDAADARDGYVLAVDEEATAFYRCIRLTLVPSPETKQSQDERRIEAALDSSGVANPLGVPEIPPPDVSTIYYPTTPSNAASATLTEMTKGMVKYACLRNNPSRWVYSPSLIDHRVLSAIRERGPSFFVLALDSLDFFSYTDLRAEVMTRLLEGRFKCSRVTVATITAPKSMLRSWWGLPLLEQFDFRWVPWAPQL